MDGVGDDLGMPRRGLHPLVVETEHLAGDLEHAVEHLVQLEILGDLVRVDAIFGLAEQRVVVLPVVRLELGGPVPGVVPQQLRHAGDLFPRGDLERLEQRVVELEHVLRVLRHPLVEQVMRPRNLAEQLGDLLADVHGLGEDHPVGLARPVVEFEHERLAEVATRGVLDERDDVGVGHGDLEAVSIFGGLQRIGVPVGHPVEVFAGHDQGVVHVCDVLLELGAQLHQTVAQLLEAPLVALGELVTCLAEVSERELEQTCPLAGERGCRFALCERLDGPVQVRSEADLDSPLRDALLELLSGRPGLLIRVDVSHEAGTSEQRGRHVADVLEPAEHRFVGGRFGACADLVDDGIGACEGLVHVGDDRLRRDGGVVEEHPSTIRRCERFLRVVVLRA